MKRLWAVTSGEYSDYSVNAVFDTEADAQAAITLGLGADLTRIEYYRAGDAPSKREVWFVDSGPIKAEGTLRTYPAEACRQEVWVPTSERFDRPRVSQERHGDRIWVTVEARTKELAEKVLHDRIAKARAELLGL